MLSFRMIIPGLALVIASQLTACANTPTGVPDDVVEPSHSDASRLAPESDFAAARVSTLSILACPASWPHQAATLIGPDGGVLRLGPHSLRIPPGSVRESVMFRVTMPPGGRLILHYDVAADDGFLLDQPAEATISYRHCSRQDLSRRAIGIVALEPSPAGDAGEGTVEHDELADTFTFWTRRFSTFAVAY